MSLTGDWIQPHASHLLIYEWKIQSSADYLFMQISGLPARGLPNQGPSQPWPLPVRGPPSQVPTSLWSSQPVALPTVDLNSQGPSQPWALPVRGPLSQGSSQPGPYQSWPSQSGALPTIGPLSQLPPGPQPGALPCSQGPSQLPHIQLNVIFFLILQQTI